MKNLTTRSLLLMMAFAFTGLMFNSCADDEITGCTDTAAENYDAAATVSGDCTYAADKFIGDYLGASDCMGGAVVGGLTNPDLMFTVAAAIGGGPNDVTISLPVMGTDVAFASTVAGDDLTVDATLPNLPFEVAPGVMVNVDIIADGVMTYDSSDDSTSGTINIVIMSVDTGSTLDNGSCNITGVKQ